MFKQLLATSAVVLALACPAFAQSTTTAPPPAAAPTATDKPSGTDAATTPDSSKASGSSATTGTAPPTAGSGTSTDRTGTTAATESPTEKMKPDQMRASKVIGKNIYGPDNKSIGEVSDLILDKDGKVDKVVVSVGGFLGIGDKHVALPMSELKHGENDRLAVNMTKEQLQQAPKYEYADRDTGARSGSSTPPAGTAGSGAGRMTR